MKTKPFLASVLTLICAAALHAGTPEQDKAFTDKFKTALEASDTATLESFLYTKDAHPMALEFFKMMIVGNAGEKVTKIELVDLTPEDVKKAESMDEGPGGEKMKLSLKPTKKLKVTTESKTGEGSSSSSSESFVAEHEGKYVIPVPAAAK